MEGATIGHNSASVGEVLNERPHALFSDPDLLPALLASIEQEIDQHRPDLKTEKGRKAIASLAYSIATRKTALDDAGKSLTEKLRAQVAEVDTVRKAMRDGMDALKKRARAPLDKWEADLAALNKRQQDIKDFFAQISPVPATATFGWIEAMRARLQSIDISEATVAGYAETIQARRAEILREFDVAWQRLKREEDDRAELARLRAADEVRQREDQERQKREREAQAARERDEQLKHEAAERAAADERRKAQEEQQRRDAEAHRQIEEAQRREREAREALEAEARRKNEEKAAEDARRADQAHRDSVMSAACEALITQAGVSRKAAEKAVLAIAAGSIPHVSMRF